MMVLRSLQPLRVPAGVRFLYAALVVVFLAFTVHAVTNVGGDGLDSLFQEWLSDSVPAGCALVCGVRAWRVPTERWAWALIGLGIAVWGAGDVYYSLFLADRAVVPVPSVADILWLGEYPASVLGVLLLMRSRHSSEDARAWLDGGIVGLAVSAIVAAVVLPSVLSASTDLSAAAFSTNVAYPVGDIILLGSIGAALAVRHWRFSRTWTGLALGFGTFALSDSLFLVKSANGTYVAGTIIDAGWLLGGLCLAAAAWQPVDAPVPGRRGRFGLLLPSLFGSASLFLLIWDHFDRLTTAALLLSSASVVAVLARMTLALGENLRMVARLREEADALSAKNEELLEIDELKESLRQAQKMEALGQLAGGVAHDFNNLLTVISGYTSLLRSKTSDGTDAADKLDAVATAAERANDLTRQLLTFSPGQIAQTSQLDLNAAVLETEALIGSALGDDIRLSLQLADGLPPILADAGQISQVLLNLVLNARDAMADGGFVEIATAKRGDESVVLTVADAGCGIDEETRARIFEPFFSTKGKDGTGLGLATVYGIVEGGGGSISVDSTVGAGTTFTLLFPIAVAAAPAAAEAAPVHAAPRQGADRVLLVEDERAVRELLVEQLAALGYHVVAAATPALACELYEGHADEFDLVVTDVVMPGMDGWHLATRLRSTCPDLPVVLMSGYTDGAIDMLDVGGATAFLQKPFGIDALAENIRAVVEHRSDAPKDRGDAQPRGLAAPVAARTA